MFFHPKFQARAGFGEPGFGRSEARGGRGGCGGGAGRGRDAAPWAAMAGGPFGGHGGPGRGDPRRGGGRGMGGPGRGGRLFEQGAIKLLALSLLAERPCHGYDLIKAIEGLVGGDYSPSPGVIYPTLAYLADRGWATATDEDGGRKQYAITAAGLEQLERQRDELTVLQDRLRGLRQEAGARGAPEIQRAMGNLKATLQVRFAQGTPDAELIRRVAALIDDAAAGIARL